MKHKDTRLPWQMTLEEYIRPLEVKPNIQPDGQIEKNGARFLEREQSKDRSHWKIWKPEGRDDIMLYSDRRSIYAVDVKSDKIVGMYQTFMPYVAPEFRGRGIVKEMHVLADQLRLRFQAGSYSESGIMARIGAHRMQVERAVQRGDVIPPLVKAQYGLGTCSGSDRFISAPKANIEWQKGRFKKSNEGVLDLYTRSNPRRRPSRKKDRHLPAPLFSDCVSWPRVASVDVLKEILGDAEYVTREMFESAVCPKSYAQLKAILGYDESAPETLQIKDDPEVRFCIGKNNIPFLVHSGIEYVFAFQDVIDEVTREFEREQETPSILVVVHPGSLCGSAISNLGRLEADGARSEIHHQIADHNGPIVVIDGALSDEIAPHENDNINAAIDRSQASGYPAFRIWGCDSGEEPFAGWKPRGVTRTIGVRDSQETAIHAISNLLPEMPLEVTGAWATPDHSSGCASSVFKELQMIFDLKDYKSNLVSMSPTVLSEPDWDVEKAHKDETELSM